MPFHQSQNQHRREVHALLSPHHQGTDDGLLGGLPERRRQLADLKNPKDPIHEFLKTHTVQVLKPHMATGARVFYNGMDGSVR